MRRNVYWLHHTNLENRSEDDHTRKSFGNAWEVEIIHRLVQHIGHQGVYSCAYTEQQQNLKEKLGKDCNIFSVENDQCLLIPKKSDIVFYQKHHPRIRIDTVSQAGL